MARVKLKIMPEMSMKFKKDVLVIDGIVDGSIEADEDSTTVLFGTEDVVFRGDVVTFTTANSDEG